MTHHFCPNVPTWERLLRLLGGVISGFAAFQMPATAWFFWSLLALAAMLALSALSGFCPGRAMAVRLFGRRCG